jgi:hypothetical protein
MFQNRVKLKLLLTLFLRKILRILRRGSDQNDHSIGSRILEPFRIDIGS